MQKSSSGINALCIKHNSSGMLEEYFEQRKASETMITNLTKINL